MQQQEDSTYTAGNLVFDRISFNANDQFKEVMREKGVKIEIHERMAMAWVPYDFWINGKLSHCGGRRFHSVENSSRVEDSCT